MPLRNLKVLDFSTLLPGPYATMMMADLGTDVLRVEATERADLLRQLPPFNADGTSYNHTYLNRSKRSIGLNLKEPEAVAIVEALVKEYDIVVEQFRPGVMERFGLGYESLRAINPYLIYCSITGFGQTGPYAGRPGHDLNYLAISGVASHTGRAGQGPLPLGVAVADIAGGSLLAMTGILSAVIERQNSGLGQHIDISMTDAAFALNTFAGVSALNTKVEPGPGMMLNGGSFYDYYETADGRYFSVAGLEPKFLRLLCGVLGRPDLVSKGLSQNPTDHQELREVLATTFKSQSFSYWQSVFADIEACVEPVLSVSEAAAHPQLRARGMVIELREPGGKVQRQVANPIRFSRSAHQYKFTGVELGAHTEQVLGQLGFDRNAIDALRKKGVVG